MIKYFSLSLLVLLLNCGGRTPEPTEIPANLPPAAKADSTAKTTQPEKPIQLEELPPAPDGWTEINKLDSTILLDLRYATKDNFVKEKMYDCPRCFFRTAVAEALVKAHKSLKKKGLGLKMYDCYRPRPIQWKLWNKVPDPRYVADPRKGSMHNRGMAADLTIVDSKGKELDMGTDFDYFGEKAYHAYTKLPKEVLDNRKLLKGTMDAVGMKFTTTEWWHYSFSAKTFPVADWVWECK